MAGAHCLQQLVGLRETVTTDPVHVGELRTIGTLVQLAKVEKDTASNHVRDRCTRAQRESTPVLQGSTGLYETVAMNPVNVNEKGCLGGVR